MKAAKVDDTQREIVAALRRIGAVVQLLHKVGQGCPDLLIGYQGANFLMEVKSGKGKLNELQAEWHENWRGQVVTVWTAQDAVDYLQNEAKRRYF